jgi:hypothetical protein
MKLHLTIASETFIENHNAKRIGANIVEDRIQWGILCLRRYFANSSSNWDVFGHYLKNASKKFAMPLVTPLAMLKSIGRYSG